MGGAVCYDQKRSFTMFIERHNATLQGYERLLNFVHAKGVLGGKKAYLSALWTDEGKTLRIFIDKTVEGAMW